MQAFQRRSSVPNVCLKIVVSWFESGFSPSAKALPVGAFVVCPPAANPANPQPRSPSSGQDFIEKSVGPRRVFAHVLDHHRQLDTWSSERAKPWHRKAQPGCRVVARRPGPAPA
jgi:hypothetical protein